MIDYKMFHYKEIQNEITHSLFSCIRCTTCCRFEPQSLSLLKSNTEFTSERSSRSYRLAYLYYTLKNYSLLMSLLFMVLKRIVNICQLKCDLYGINILWVYISQISKSKWCEALVCTLIFFNSIHAAQLFTSPNWLWTL